MKNIHYIGIAAGVFVVLGFILILNVLRSSPSAVNTAAPSPSLSPSPFNEVKGNPFIPTPFSEAEQGSRYIFRQLEFTVPDTWTALASPRAGTVLIQPAGTKSALYLPRLQISELSRAEYTEFSEITARRTKDPTLVGFNTLVKESYRDLHPGYTNPDTGETETIQERLAILENNNTYYTVYLQYGGTGRNDAIEDFYTLFIESLSFQ